MKTIKGSFSKIQTENPLYGSIVCFNLAIMGQKFNKDSIIKWFSKLIKKEEYIGSSKKQLIRYCIGL